MKRLVVVALAVLLNGSALFAERGGDKVELLLIRLDSVSVWSEGGGEGFDPLMSLCRKAWGFRTLPDFGASPKQVGEYLVAYGAALLRENPPPDAVRAGGKDIIDAGLQGSALMHCVLENVARALQAKARTRYRGSLSAVFDVLAATNGSSQPRLVECCRTHLLAGRNRIRVPGLTWEYSVKPLPAEFTSEIRYLEIEKSGMRYVAIVSRLE